MLPCTFPRASPICPTTVPHRPTPPAHTHPTLFWLFTPKNVLIFAHPIPIRVLSPPHYSFLPRGFPLGHINLCRSPSSPSFLNLNFPPSSPLFLPAPVSGSPQRCASLGGVQRSSRSTPWRHRGLSPMFQGDLEHLGIWDFLRESCIIIHKHVQAGNLGKHVSSHCSK